MRKWRNGDIESRPGECLSVRKADGRTCGQGRLHQQDRHMEHNRNYIASAIVLLVPKLDNDQNLVPTPMLFACAQVACMGLTDYTAVCAIFALCRLQAADGSD